VVAGWGLLPRAWRTEVAGRICLPGARVAAKIGRGRPLTSKPPGGPDPGRQSDRRELL
jgi:hypothetical protein